MNQEAQASNAPSQGTRQLPKAVFAITERGEGIKSIWTRIGSAWTNRDGSLTIRLDALPVNGVMQVREQEERRDAPVGGAR